MRTLISNARLVLADVVVEGGTLLIEDEHIAAIAPEAPRAERVVDVQGALLLPGLIDLHCDALEKDIEPRPNTFFPLPFALSVADRRAALCGITTSFHAISFAHGELGVRNVEVAAAIVEAMKQAQAQALVDNRVHARYEITDPQGLAVLLTLLEQGQLDLLSLMDHTPGQGQFTSLHSYQHYLERTYATDADSVAELVVAKQAQQPEARKRVALLAALAGEVGVPLLSHDDDSPARVAQMAALGVAMSEFPLNLETAQAAVALGMATLVGAPNLLRGRSQSGGLRAVDAIGAGAASCLCSDYAPHSLLLAALKLPELCGWHLPKAVALVTAHPAAAAGLHDRGVLAVGKRADCIAVREQLGDPQLLATWVAGRQVLRVSNDW